MTLKEALAQLEARGNEKVRAQNRRKGVGDQQYGVLSGDIRKIAARIKVDPALATALWETGNLDAQLLAVLIMDPKRLPLAEVDRLVKTIQHEPVADWFISYIAKKHPENEALRERWMTEKHAWAARAGWSLTYDRIGKDAAGLDLTSLLNRIESEMPGAAPEVQWTMNFGLAAIGIHSAKHRKRAIALGEKLGMYRDYPVSKGCTSPYAPIWINEMVRRAGG